MSKAPSRQSRIDRLRITRLTLQNWRNFRSASLSLKPRAFFIGPNASGKSNLLDSLRFLRDVAVEVHGGFQTAVDVRGGVTALRCLAARTPPEVGIEVEIGNDAAPNQWRYRLEFSKDKKNQTVIRKEIVWQGSKILLERPDTADRADPLRLRQTRLELIAENREFRDLAAFFASIDYLHIVPQLIRAPDRWAHGRRDPFGADLLARLAGTNEKTRKARLDRIQRALAVAVPQLDYLRMEQDERGVWHLVGGYRHWRPNSAGQRESSFSDGTLRLLGILWSLAEGEGPLLLEEPELSLHATVAAQIPSMIARMQQSQARQVLVTTHSEALLNNPGIGLAEIHVLTPGAEGTRVDTASDDASLRALQEGDMPLGEAVIPRSKAPGIEQLGLFDVAR